MAVAVLEGRKNPTLIQNVMLLEQRDRPPPPPPPSTHNEEETLYSITIVKLKKFIQFKSSHILSFIKLQFSVLVSFLHYHSIL